MTACWQRHKERFSSFILSSQRLETTDDWRNRSRCVTQPDSWQEEQLTHETTWMKYQKHDTHSKSQTKSIHCTVLVKVNFRTRKTESNGKQITGCRGVAWNYEELCGMMKMFLILTAAAALHRWINLPKPKSTYLYT